MKKKIMGRAVLTLLFGSCCLSAASGFAAAPATRELAELKAQIEELQQRNEALSRRLATMEEGLAGQSARILDQMDNYAL